ncbi:unnamed protein product, partial [Phaeothamnion confervicola]
MSAAAPLAKIPLWRTTRDSYVLGFRHMAYVIAKRWLVIAALATLTFLVQWLIYPSEKLAGQLGLSWVSFALLPLAAMVFTAMIAVPWHRLILDNELVAGNGLSLDARVIAYWIWGAALLIALGFAATPMFYVFPSGPDVELTGFQTGALLASLLATAIVGWVLMRISLKLVGVALRDSNASLGVIWNNTSWNFWRLFWGTILTCVPAMAAVVVHSMLIEDENLGRETYALARAFDSTLVEILGLIPLTFLSLSYRHFMGRQ